MSTIDFVLDNFWYIAPPVIIVGFLASLAERKQLRKERQEDIRNAINDKDGN